MAPIALLNPATSVTTITGKVKKHVMRGKYSFGGGRSYRVGLPPLLILPSWRVQKVQCFGNWSRNDSKVIGDNRGSMVVKAASEGGAISLPKHWPLSKVICKLLITP
ncbi:hypothetical protein S83_070171 [Arachis hypogaea]